MEYAKLSEDSVRLISEAEQKIKALTGQDVILIAYPAQEE